MESTQELQHWGIKGQKWGIRRYQNPDGSLTEAGKKRYYYQNPDGSLTEAGKKDYMKAAKKGKLDVSKLSDNDLNMINLRFAREKTFKQNVSDYEKSTLKYKLKKAALDRIKSFGRGGGGKGNGKSKGGVASLLAMPIKKAFEEAFKDTTSVGGKDDDGDSYDREASKRYKEYRNNGHIWQKGYEFSKIDEHNRKLLEKEGKRFLDTSAKDWVTGENRTTGSQTIEEVVRSRSKPKPAPKPQKGARTREIERERKLEERLSKIGLVLGHSMIIVRRDSPDELYHHGIKGQKWGVRRFENPDGTLTPEGKERYRSYADKAKKEIGDASRDPHTSMGVYYAAGKESRLGDKEAKKYRELDKVVNKASRKFGTAYGSKPTKENAKAFADAVASSGLQYITENFPESKQGEAKAFVYAMFVQMQDKAIRKEFGPINN